MNQTVQLLKALAEPTRLRIVALCRTGGDLAGASRGSPGT